MEEHQWDPWLLWSWLFLLSSATAQISEFQEMHVCLLVVSCWPWSNSLESRLYVSGSGYTHCPPATSGWAASSEMKYFVKNFQTSITWSFLAQILKSRVVLEFSHPELQDSGLTCWIWWRFEGDMKGFSRVLSYRARLCNILLSGGAMRGLPWQSDF